MSTLTVHTQETAPDASAIHAAQNAFGFVPNLIGVLSESPAVAQAYLQLSGLLDKTSLTSEETQAILIAISVENGCEYCVAAHTTVAGGTKLDDATIDALRAGEALSDPRLNALVRFARTVVQERGWVNESALESFFEAGFTKANVLDVILAASLKTISNYTNHISQTPVDAAFQAAAWSKA